MKKCEEKAPTNEAAALREMMIKNFGGGHHNEAQSILGNGCDHCSKCCNQRSRDDWNEFVETDAMMLGKGNDDARIRCEEGSQP